VFIQKNDPIEETDYYRGDKLHEFVSTMLVRPRLTLSRISQILGDHHVIKNSYRDRFKVEDKNKSKGKERVKNIVQYKCYQFDENKLSEATNHYPKGGKDGN
jgi:hypothetical protein